jgi:H+/gluconate symporter-like permease
MSFLNAIGALAFLMFVAYRGFSMILFAPLAAVLAVLLTDPSAVPPIFTGVFMERMVGFVKLYFPVFLLGAVFGKVIELSGFSKSIVTSVITLVGCERAMLSIVLVCALLTYGGVSLFVVVFAVYPFAAEMFKQGGIPKQLIPGTIALGAFTFTMDALPGSPQIQNIIPTTMADQFIAAANASGIPHEVLHRVAAMASGGMDTLPPNGVVITVLAVTGLTHRQSYIDVFAITLIKALAVFVVIAMFYLTGIV